MNQGARARLLVVDDEQGIVEVVTTALNSAGYQVDSTDQAHIAIEAVRRGGLDAVILDVGLGDRSGFELMERWTAEGHRVPVIFLTARTDEEDVTRGLSIGADDYIRKPFGVKELIARVESVLRRTGGQSGSISERDVLRFADIRLDRCRFEVYRSGRPLQLSPIEFRLLEVLMENGGRILTRGQLIDRVWTSGEGADDSTLETTISRLRGKLHSPEEPDLLVTRRGIGYGLVGGSATSINTASNSKGQQ
ncbi:MAG: response regulator transcription factor [Microthrixaceae bacterium]